MQFKKIKRRIVSYQGQKFDSQAELKCFKTIMSLIRSTDIIIDRQYPIKLKEWQWKVDFILMPTTIGDRTFLLNLSEAFDRNLHNGNLYIEYKGILDKNFMDKFTYLSKKNPVAANSVLLLSDRCLGVTVPLTTSIRYYPVVDMVSFKRIARIANRV